jgi:branched-chain amino acid aminotransferase
MPGVPRGKGGNQSCGATGGELMALNYYEKVWHNGKFIPWAEATVHVASHVVSYASCLFEGIRCYETPQGPAIFRLKEHTDRLVNSCKIYRMELEYTREQLAQAMVELVRENNVKHCYLRPVVFRGYGEAGVNPLKNPIEIYLLAWAWGKYLGDEALRQGVDVCVSSWQRIAPNTLPAIAKSAANYMNAQLIKMEALTNGYVEGISLDVAGHVSEGSGENLFLIRDGKIITPPLAASVLPGITRDSVITLAQEMGYSVSEQSVSREMLYIADELFFTGTAAEITPIRSVDRIVVGTGQPGPVTRKLQERFLSIVQGQAEDKYGWLTLCTQPVAASP